MSQTAPKQSLCSVPVLVASGFLKDWHSSCDCAKNQGNYIVCETKAKLRAEAHIYGSFSFVRNMPAFARMDACHHFYSASFDAKCDMIPNKHGWSGLTLLGNISKGLSSFMGIESVTVPLNRYGHRISKRGSSFSCEVYSIIMSDEFHFS